MHFSTRMTLIIIVTTVCLHLAVIKTHGYVNNIEVRSPAGTFQAIALISQQGHQYTAFLGIPYAIPPLGELRFSKPKPYPVIQEIFEATKFGPICLQPKGVDLGSPGQEDCLYLNVFIPFTNKSSPDVNLKKVFVFIHGGSYFMGSANEHVPGDLVAMGDVIVVTFNYRLSWLGFLKGDSPELPGNQGLWDQLLALTWVKNNIRSFGGDPDDITVGGNSMGGESVSALSIMKPAQTLFSKGLIMSGTMFTCPSTPGSSDVLLELLTDRVGCKSDPGGPRNVSEIVRCLRDLPAESFILPLEGQYTNKFTTIDGELFPAPITTLVEDLSYLKSVGFYDRDYIVSLTSNEGAIEFFGPFDLQINPDEIDADFFSKRFRIPLRIASQMLKLYKNPGFYKYNSGYDAVADPVMVIPTFKFLESFAANRQEDVKGKSYFLWFDHSPTFMPLTIQGMVHGLDLTYLFDLQPKEILHFYYGLQVDKGFEPEDYDLKNLYNAMLTDFMKKGDPGLSLKQKFDITWPPFDLEAEPYLCYGPTPSVRHRPIFKRRQLWLQFLPYLLSEHSQEKLKEEL
ncbi:unnamed protein product [Lymnaea stagnalis]|uniref:Carboxylesterase type B domain-containing protein n=1 Tax=Lymnaea stagnalis TaxID=6523 RepID=A0AAV2IG97_LYMST